MDVMATRYIITWNIADFNLFSVSLVFQWKRICLQCRRCRQEMQVLSLVKEDPLEDEMTTHSSILACEIPWTEEPGRLQYMKSQKSIT